MAFKTLDLKGGQRFGQWLNNRAENSHQPFRRRERAMGRFRSYTTLQNFASGQTSLNNYFNTEGHLTSRGYLLAEPSHRPGGVEYYRRMIAPGPAVKRPITISSDMQVLSDNTTMAAVDRQEATLPSFVCG